MEIKFTFEELEVQKAVRKFVSNDLMPVAREIDETGCLPADVKEKFFAMGLLKTAFPESYGGAGGSLTALILTLKALSHASLLPAWMLFENFMLAHPLSHYGSEFLKKTFLPRLIDFDTVGAFAFTEADTGSDPAQLQTAAQKEAGGWRITGSKRFITHSGTCDQMILFAKTAETVTAFLVESGKPGYRVGKRETFVHARAFDNGEVHLEDYFAADEYVIGSVGQGFHILLETETVGKIAFSSLFVGVAERALELALDYARTRTHRNTPIGQKFQMTQYKLAEMKTKLDAMNAYLCQVCAKVDRGEDISLNAATLKLLVAESVKDITARAMEIHGAYGLSEEFEVGNLYKVAISAQVVMGSLDIQRVIIAKGMLSKGR
jgi:alkylation response protein AidB-like acyl-CoA dehydrogenase